MEESALKYSPLHQDHDESLKRLLDHSGEYEPQPPQPGVRGRFRHLPWLVHACLISFYLIYSVVLLTRKSMPTTTAACLEELEEYSPALPAVEYELTKINGVFDATTPYTGSGPTVDAAWDRLTDNTSMKIIRLSDEELRKLHKDGRASNVRFSEEDGGGSMGALNMVHQIHCVDFFRQYTYPEDYPDLQDLWNKRPIFMRYHIDHCIELLRQAIMCNADIGVVTYNWIEGFTKPYPDFSIYKKCRKVENIIDWVHRNQIHIQKDHLDPLGDEVPLAMPPDATQRPKWELN